MLPPVASLFADCLIYAASEEYSLHKHPHGVGNILPGPKLGKSLAVMLSFIFPLLYKISVTVNEPGLAQLCPVVKTKVATI